MHAEFFLLHSTYSLFETHKDIRQAHTVCKIAVRSQLTRLSFLQKTRRKKSEVQGGKESKKLSDSKCLKNNETNMKSSITKHIKRDIIF